MPAWVSESSSSQDYITKAVFDASFASVRPETCYRWFYRCEKLTDFEGMEYLNTSQTIDMQDMFRGCESLKSIDLSHFDTSNAEYMIAMFRSCSGLTSLDVSHFDTRKVKSMDNMFCGCTKLKTIDVSKFDTQNVYSFRWMFGYCNGLTSIDLRNFSTKSLQTVELMFENCKNLITVDLSSFNTEKVTNTRKMFYNCANLKTIYTTENFTVQNVTNSEEMFTGCTSLVGAIAFDSRYIDYKYATVDGGYFTDKQYTRPYVVYKKDYLNELHFNYGYKKDLGNDEFLLNKDNEEPGWLKYSDIVNEVWFNESFSRARPTSCYKWFYGFKCMWYYMFRHIENLNTSEVTRMDYMFANCTKLTNSITNLSSLDTHNVKNIEGMFKGCTSIPSIDLSNFNTQNVTNMSYMFSGCSALTSLDLSKFNTANVTNMSRLFENCSSLDSLNLSSFNTAKLTTAPSMFNGCSNLKTIDVSSFNTAKMDNMGHMFANCSNLTTLDLTNFNTSAAKWVDNMFKNCSNLTTIYASENFALGSNVQNSAGMFTGCTKLVGAIAYDANMVDKTYAKVDGGYFTDKVYTRPWVKYTDGALTFKYGYKKTLDSEEYAMNEAWNNPSWNSKSSSVTKVVFDNSFAYARPTTCYRWFTNCSNLTDIEGIENLNTSESTVLHLMFYGCKKLTSLDLSNFDTRKVTNMNWMFLGCSNLKNIYVSDKFVGGSTENFAESSSVFYCSPVQYNATKKIAAFASNTVKPYVCINPNAEYGTLCVPIGSTLAESSYSGFDKLYTIKSADKDKGTITMVEATEIEPGVAYVYRRNLPEGDTESIITFDANMEESTAVTAPKNDGSLLKGTFSRITAPGGCYILQTDGNFHPVSADNTTLGVGAYRAYLDLSSLDVDGGYAKAYKMVFEDNQTTAIDGISEQTNNKPKTYFDLMGRRVSTPKIGGLYIVNGKKVMYNN